MHLAEENVSCWTAIKGKNFCILIWVDSMVCMQSGHFNSSKALSSLSVSLTPWTDTVIYWLDRFAMECAGRLSDLLWGFLPPVLLKIFPCWITYLMDTEIPLESRDQGENKLGPNELWNAVEWSEIGKGQELGFVDTACTEQLRKMETFLESL